MITEALKYMPWVWHRHLVAACKLVDEDRCDVQSRH